MSTTEFDPAAFKRRQMQDWDGVAAGWRKWWPWFESAAQHVSDRLIQLAAVGTGSQVLDVATGTGEPAVTAAAAVGPAGSVIATDQSSGMLAIARERATEKGLDNLDLREQDAESLDFSDERFDAVLCRWGLMFMPDLPGALGHIRRVLRPGGRFATSIWGPPEKTPGLSLAMGVVNKLIQPPPPPEDAPSMYKLSPAGTLEAAIAQAGFTRIEAERQVVDFAFSGVDEYITFLQEVVVVITELLADASAERQAQVWEAIAAAVGPFTDEKGKVSLPSETILVVGAK